MTNQPQNPLTIQRLGTQALIEKLGIAGAISFLQQFDRGHGDYTRDRHEWQDTLTIEQVVREIRERGNHSRPA